MVSVCQHYFTLFVKIIFSGVDGQFKRNGGFYLEVSGSEELVGEITGDGEVGLVKKYNIRVHRLCVRALRAREANNQVSV